MKKVSIKVILPDGWYTRRTLKVLNQKKELIHRLSPNDTLELTVEDNFTVKLDWYSLEVKLDELITYENGEAYIVVNFKKEFKFFGLENLFYLNFSHKVVSAEVFAGIRAEEIYGINEEYVNDKLDIFFVLCSIMVSIIMLALNYFFEGSDLLFKSFAVVISLIGITLIYIDRNKLTLSQYKLRAIFIILLLSIVAATTRLELLNVDLRPIFFLMLFTMLWRSISFTLNSKNVIH